MKVQEFLQQHRVPFDVLTHRATYDAQHMAEEIDVSGYEVAKTVLLRAEDQTYIVAVLPATLHIDLEMAARAVGGKRVVLATEIEMAERCPDSEMGALPPFGSQHGMTTLVDKRLADKAEIVFEGDTHEESIRIAFEEFCALEQPVLASFAVP